MLIQATGMLISASTVRLLRWLSCAQLLAAAALNILLSSPSGPLGDACARCSSGAGFVVSFLLNRFQELCHGLFFRLRLLQNVHLSVEDHAWLPGGAVCCCGSISLDPGQCKSRTMSMGNIT